MSATVEELLGIDEPRVDFKRDQWDRPLIVPRDGGAPRGYTRCSSAAKTVDDTFNLELWARRNVAFGMAHDRSLVARLLAVGGTPREWDKAGRSAVNKIVEDAQQVAKAHEAADIGTAVHELTHRLDRGDDVVAGPYQDDLIAYRQAQLAAGLIVNPDWIECRMVCDDLQMAGTADRIFTVEPGSPLARFLGLERDEAIIADLKTGESVDYGGLGWAAQLAAYAHGELYDIETDTRTATPTINRQRGLIVHLPASQGRCDLYLVDLIGGYEAARLANEIRATRKAARGWLEPMATAAPIPTSDDELMAALEASVAQVAQPSSGPVVPAERIVAASLQLRARLNAAVAAGARQITWPDHVARFADGGPTTWAEVLEVEAVVLGAETEAGMPFENKLPADPTAPPEPDRFAAAPVADLTERQPAIDEEAVDALRAMHDALPIDLQHAAKGMVIAAGLPVDRRLWRSGHREPLAAILQSATDQHAKRKALLASTLQDWQSDDLLGVVLNACGCGSDALDEATADQAARVVAVIEALDAGHIAIGTDEGGAPVLTSTDQGYLAVSSAYDGSKGAVLAAAREIAALHGLTKPRSASTAAADPVLRALLLSTTNQAKEQ